MPTISPATGFRYFSKGFGDAHASPAFQYVQESGVVWSDGHGVYTGAWRPMQSTDLGSTTNLSVSGLSLTVGSVAVTGNPQVTVSNTLLATSGNSTIANTAPIPVSGVVVIPFTNPVYVTGNFGSAGGGTSSVILTGNNTVNANITGNPTVIISGFNPIWVTGNFTTSAPAITAVSGNVQANITNTAPIAISGVVNTTVTVGNVAITGFDSRIPPLAVSGSLTVAAAAITPISGNVTIINSVVQPVLSSGGYLGVTGTVSTNDTSGNLYLASISGSLISLLADNVAITGTVSTNITNTAPIAISGVVNTTVTITNVAVTGQVVIASASQELALLSGIQTGLLGISGQLATNLAGSAPISGDIRNIPGTLLGVTGTVVIPFTSPVYVTGSFSSTVTNPLGVTGTARDINLVYSGVNTYNFLPIGGRAVAATGVGSVTGYSSGAFVMMNFDANNGALMVEQGVSDKNFDSIQVFTAGSGLALASGITGSTGSAGINFGVVLNANPSRLGWGIQALGTGAIMLAFSSNIASTGNLNMILKGCSSSFAGDGASFVDMPAIWKGPVSVSGFNGAMALYTKWEI